MTQLAAIDWGTSSFRAWLLDHNGEILRQVATKQGILQPRTCSFAALLRENLAQLQIPEKTAIIASGMITSSNGWRETPYLPCPAGTAALASNLVHHNCPDIGEIWFVPGISQHHPEPDIMRGEETQLAGMDTGEDTTVVLPGTHSKWVKISKGNITGFTTFMTGELFSAVTRHTILAHCGSTFESEDDFLQGVDTATNNQERTLLSLLFQLRANSILKTTAPQSHRYLSGLFIGMEIREAQKRGYGSTVQIAGEKDLVQLYRSAFNSQKITVASIEENSAAKGLFRIARQKGII